jgi:hypothetical protein
MLIFFSIIDQIFQILNLAKPESEVIVNEWSTCSNGWYLFSMVISFLNGVMGRIGLESLVLLLDVVRVGVCPEVSVF